MSGLPPKPPLPSGFKYVSRLNPHVPPQRAHEVITWLFLASMIALGIAALFSL